MRDKPTRTLLKHGLFAATVLILFGFLRLWPFVSPFRPAADHAAAPVNLAAQQSPAAVASPTMLPTRLPATALPTQPPTSAPPTPTPTAVSLPVAGRARELTIGKTSVYGVLAREHSSRVPDRPPTPTLVPTPPSQPPTRIVAAAIGLDAPVVPMYWKEVARGGKVSLQWAVPRNEAGWHFDSALPGLPGNTVISGHRNIYTEVFRNLDDLRPGDAIELVAGPQRYTYHVDEILVLPELGVSASVRAQNARWIAPTNDVRLTLVTCWPYEAPGNTHRLIVVARP
jgi:sortase A